MPTQPIDATSAPIRYILAEYCAAEIYHGWWLYERETNDGQPNYEGHWADWGWFRDGYPGTRLSGVREMLVSLGYEPPAIDRLRIQEFAEWFAANFPNGIRVRVGEFHTYEFDRIEPSRPKQPRRVIRTIRGARVAEAFRRKAERKPTA